ncbi:hypothetical protein Bbelb_310270 [Branchiostoma belcheri]|nr:hypothetical protein Bbelb_310270 [Branchiostoma belcheri]
MSEDRSRSSVSLIPTPDPNVIFPAETADLRPCAVGRDDEILAAAVSDATTSKGQQKGPVPLYVVGVVHFSISVTLAPHRSTAGDWLATCWWRLRREYRTVVLPAYSADRRPQGLGDPFTHQVRFRVDLVRHPFTRRAVSYPPVGRCVIPAAPAVMAYCRPD